VLYKSILFKYVSNITSKDRNYDLRSGVLEKRVTSDPSNRTDKVKNGISTRYCELAGHPLHKVHCQWI